MSNEMLIRCCAPTMASLKTGNMFSCPFGSREEMTSELRRLNRILGHKGLRILPLRWNDGCALVYLYRPKMLEKDLRNDLASKLLSECGYTCGNPSCCIAQLIARLRNDQGFPHEVGLFLGYPPADVDGFMHRKHACKLSGIWKVYDDVEHASRQFARCKHCTEVYAYWLAAGFQVDADADTVKNVIELFCLENMDYSAHSEGSLAQLKDLGFEGKWIADMSPFGKAYADVELFMTIDESGHGLTFMNGQQTRDFEAFAFDNGEKGDGAGLYVAYDNEAKEPEAAPYTMVTNDNNQIVLTFYATDGVISYMKAE